MIHLGVPDVRCHPLMVVVLHGSTTQIGSNITGIATVSLS